ncbi:hypothetical protein [Ensifer adhaerens]|uniref:hypothetical protein n=1 Tax=Ensifer adhaerens TaxID=106592 RepID=UPI000CF1AC1E|nr:hypothetical protein [Ensifer adhaerens]
MELKFNLDTMSSSQLGWLIDSLDAYRARRDGFTQHAQPEVAQNTGSSEPAPPFTGDPAGQPESAAEDSPPTSSAAPAVTEQKRGRPRKETAQESTAPAVEEQAPAEPAKESAQPITLDDLRAALQVFTAKNGIEAGMPLLAQYNARRISEMAEQPEDAKAAFIKECQA